MFTRLNGYLETLDKKTETGIKISAEIFGSQTDFPLSTRPCDSTARTFPEPANQRFYFSKCIIRTKKNRFPVSNNLTHNPFIRVRTFRRYQCSNGKHTQCIWNG